MKKVFTFIFSLIMVGVASAQTISPNVAAQKASGIFANVAKSSTAKRNAKAISAEPQLAYVSVLDGDTCFYVFNYPQGGYAIIGGDFIAREVLATVDDGVFDINNIPDAQKFMLSEYAQNIRAAKGRYVTSSPKWTCGPDITKSIMTTHWTQDFPYNGFCPDYDDNDYCATGCVATAAAQAVYKALKDKFTTGKKSKTYKHTVETASGTKTVKQTYDATVEIDWNMKNSYSEDDTSAKAANVAYLMQIMGIISEMQYGEQSGADSETLTRGLWNNLGIAAKYLHKENAGMSDQEWEYFIYNELAAGRPVIMGADTPNGKSGHEFVIDGYQKENDNFHVNWGWGEGYDGYFALTGTIAKAAGMAGENKGEGSWMFPTAQGTGGSGQTKETAKNSAYRNGHEIVYNLVMRGANESKSVPEVDASVVTVKQDNQSYVKALNAVAAAEDTIPTIYVGDDSEESYSYAMTVSFGQDGVVYDGEDAEFIWGVILEPIFEEGEEPDEYDCYILDATNGEDEPVEYKAGDVITGFNIPVGEYGWSADGAEDEDGYETMKVGKFSVTPIMYFDPNGDSEYIDEDNIAYVATPYGWKAPVANFVLGAKPNPTAISNVKVAAQSAGKACKKIVKNRVIIEKNGKQYNAAGQRIM